MTTTIQKWGNSQGLRVPKSVLEQARIEVGDEVLVSAEEGSILVRRKEPPRRRRDLRTLVAKMPQNYTPAEEEWGPPIGREVW